MTAFATFAVMTERGSRNGSRFGVLAVDAESDETVSLDEGWSVPTRFVARGFDAEQRLQLSLTVVMDGRVPLIEAALVWGVNGPSLRPMPFEEIAALRWSDLKDAVLQSAAYWWTPGRGWHHPDWKRDTADLDAEADSLRTAVAKARRYRTDVDKLRAVLDLHERGGVDLIMQELSYSERNARRLLARARRELS
jgi:hypothetical protein